MEPNQNMAGEGDLNTASVAQQNNAGAPEPEQSIAPVTEQKDLPEPDNLPEQNVVPTSNDDLSKHDTTEKKKGGNGMMIGMILAIILAIGGIGFGAWAMMDGNQQKEELNSQISSLKKQNNGLMEKAEDTCATTEEITDNTANTGNTKDYIYVGEWGLKVKLPSELKQVVYEVRNGHTDGEADVAWQYQSGRSSLFVFGLLDEKVKNTNGYTIETANTCSSAWIIRIPKSQGFSNPDFSIGDYDFVFGGWQAGCYDENGNEQSDFAGKIIRNALMERENWSSI